MSTLKTVAAFDNPADAERTIESLVDAGIDPNGIEVIGPLDGVSEDPAALLGASPDAPAQAGEDVLLAVTAPEEDTMLVEEILSDAGEIDSAASQTPAVGWSGDPEGENLDKSRTPATGWSGRQGRPE